MKQLFILRRGLLILFLSFLLPFRSIAIDKIKDDNASNLFFLENKGQITDQHYKQRKDIDFKFTATKDLNVFVANGAIYYQWAKATNLKSLQESEKGKVQEHVDYKMYRMDVQLVGANKDAELVKEESDDYYENYYGIGGVNAVVAHTFRKVRYVDVYPNIDWVLYTINGKLKHEFFVKNGGNPADIKIKYSGATDLKINIDGSLTATTPMGEIVEASPYSYTLKGRDVLSSFQLSNNILSYDIGSYEGELIIDPSIEWGGYYAGLSDDHFLGATTSSAGISYACGYTYSSSNIATSGAHDANYSANADGMIVKLMKSGGRYWGTYYGSTESDVAYDISVDNSGNVYTVGYSNSTTGIATSGSKSGGYDGFIVKMNTNGMRLFGRYLGGVATDFAYAVALASNGDIYICGRTSSVSMPTNGAAVHQKSRNSVWDCYLARYSSNGTKQMCTLIGGEGDIEYIYDIVIDKNSNAILSGYTNSKLDLASNGIHQSIYGGGMSDAFIASFKSDGSRNWASYYGGPDAEYASALALDKSDNIYMAGRSSSTSAIATNGTWQTSKSGGEDAYLVKFSNSGSRIWGTYYGGSANDEIDAITIDGSDNVIVGGSTNSSNNIATPNNHMSSYAGNGDAFMASFSNNGARNWGTYFGGSSSDYINGMGNDADGNIYAFGVTSSKSGIATPGTLISTYVNGTYGFAAMFCNNPEVSTQPSSTTANKGTQATFTVAASGGSLNYQWQTDQGTGFQNISNSGQFSGVTTNTLTINNVSTANNNTKYRCKINSGSCEILSNSGNLTVTTVGINDIELNSFEISPNPSTGIITIHATDIIKKVEVFSVTGRKLLAETPNKSKLTLNMTTFNAGMYIVKVNDTYVKRVVKQ